MLEAAGEPVKVPVVPNTRLFVPKENNPLVSFRLPFKVTFEVFRLTPAAFEISRVELTLFVIIPAPEIDWAAVPFKVTVPAEAGEKFRILEYRSY
jgi:hypothetical protein